MKFTLSKSVKDAINNNKPVLALESTIIASGMPYPQNIEFQNKAERVCASLGVVPATIAIIKGVVHVGLGPKELNFIATNPSVKKISKREIGICLEKNISGATTVSSTSHFAHLAGIKVFSTGGIGGVHRGYKTSLDMSQDLFSLSQTPIVVVCSGVKSFLNVEKTIEALETFGVTTVGYKTDTFPLFYSSKSNNKLQYSFNTVGGLVGTYRENIKNQLQSSLLVLNPVPKKDEILEEKIKNIISKSISKMEKLGIIGNKTTPFLLNEIAEKTKNKSLETNISLALNNIKLGAKIALEM
ncbi:pseudouridine-5'-phosphate glycosidase [bacterium]|jgi:pseudouridine-5'-phosphate glycosidase|nr:pseudouridine-5'-phosphate glycosidase [bacterium]MBT4248992.1 pseudouridine-5'-phosphate glycosidase [bacterium]